MLASQSQAALLRQSTQALPLGSLSRLPCGADLKVKNEYNKRLQKPSCEEEAQVLKKIVRALKTKLLKYRSKVSA